MTIPQQDLGRFPAVPGAARPGGAQPGMPGSYPSYGPYVPGSDPIRWRYIAMRALTGEILHWDLQLQQVQLGRALNAGPSLTGQISPYNNQALLAVQDDGLPLLDKWSTAVFAEGPHGRIVWGGLLSRISRQGPQITLESGGYFGWLARTFYTGKTLTYKGKDPLSTSGPVHELIKWAQERSYSNLGILVDGDTNSSLKVGNSSTPVQYTAWDHPEIAQAIQDLSGTQPGFDFYEWHDWHDAATNRIDHHLTLRYPRAGKRRDDLSFISGVNISDSVPAVEEGDEYANTIIADGAGTGSKARRSLFLQADGRPRIEVVDDAQWIKSQKHLDDWARQRAQVRSSATNIDTLEVIQHENAPLGSWELGDDIYVQVETEWDTVAGWYRIMGDTWSPEKPNVATLNLQPSANFLYGS